MTIATTQAAPNIAFVKCWGNRDNILRLPMNGSISMNLGGLFTRTKLSFQRSLPFDELDLNLRPVGYECLSCIADFPAVGTDFR
jgi:diphosphomevalonate decarboxylase